MAIKDKIQRFFNYNILDIPKDLKAIGMGWRQTGTVLPPGDEFAHFIQIASDEDSPRYITIKNPYLDNAWVYSAIRIMAENLAQVPFQLKIGDELIEENSVNFGWLKRLFDYVGPYMNKYSLFESIPVWLSLRGECFWRLVRSDVGNQIVSIKVPIPTNMKEIKKDGELVAWEEWTSDGKKNIWDKEDIILFKYFNPYNSMRGLSPLVSSMLGLNVDYAAAAYNFYFFNNDSTPVGVITTDQDLDDEEADGVRERWNKNQKGLRRKGRIAVLSRGGKYQPIGLAQKDIQYLQQRKWSREEVFAVLQVPPALAGVLEHASIKSNIKEQKTQLYENNLIPKMHFIEDVLKTEFFAREKNIKQVEGKFDITSIAALKKNFNETLEQAEKLQRLGFTSNEINEKLELGFEDQDWRDHWWVNMTMAPADSEKEELKPGTPEKPEPKKEPEEQKQLHKGLIWKALIRKIDPIERDFAKELAEYFYKMRQDVLENILSRKSIKGIEEELLFNETEYNKILDGISRKSLEEAYEVGIASLSGVINTTYDMTYNRAVQSLSKRIRAITGINKTIQHQLLADYRPVLERGLREGLSYEQVAGELAEIARVKFNNARARSKTIARTEINGAMNQARQDTMTESGIKKQEWTSSLDAVVRPSHSAADGEVRALDERFSNGLYYPHDPGGDAGEVINCRCVAIPYIED